MVNDYQGDPKEFALVVPVPTFIQREQIDIVDKTIVDHLDAYSAPRLVEYFDENPCAPIIVERMVLAAPAAKAEVAGPKPSASPSKPNTPSANTTF